MVLIQCVQKINAQQGGELVRIGKPVYENSIAQVQMLDKHRMYHATLQSPIFLPQVEICFPTILHLLQRGQIPHTFVLSPALDGIDTCDEQIQSPIKELWVVHRAGNFHSHY